MAAKNPLFHGRWTAKKLSATVIDDIWLGVLLFTLIATMVVLVSEKTSVDLGVSNQLLTVLGLVLGLVISFRTSSAYERYQDGRKMWTSIIVASKNLAQMIWVHVPTDRPTLAGSTPLQCVIEKKSVINLIQAWSVSVKHLLRGEQGVYYEDLYPLISFLPRYANQSPQTGVDEAERLPLWHLPEGFGGFTPKVIPDAEPKIDHEREKTLGDVSSGASGSRKRSNSFNPEALLPQLESEIPLRPARNPPQLSMYDHIPLLRLFRWFFRVVTRTKPSEVRVRRRKAYADVVESIIPLEISLVLSNYSGLMKNNLIQPSIASGITNNIFLLQDTVSNLERICNTPLPFAYQAHLRISLWIYLALLPFQIYGAYGVITIPATAFSSFLLLGFLEIGQEIENPFNYDLNDLDLDYFCLSIQRELHQITAHVNPDLSEYIFTKWNQPFAPSDRRHAKDLTKEPEYRSADSDGTAEPGLGSIRRTLVTGWKMVDSSTRNK
ncbi:hypothetical protein GALMADRAFT_73850 [Galerina marginata CBS 339.88]|uniref:Uncharacterized protein n=1 Tax=Galerina marginata (strain CBS 339.88) TaxID=685588 RepID=A0A067T0Y3_GALM3|nr:hypothetical protein GALMADRAFT_73850 [Galerina marginata CBS 339.88]